MLQAPFEWLDLGYCCAMLLLQETAASSTSQQPPLVPLASSWTRHGQTEMAHCHFSAHLCRFLFLWADPKTYTALSIRPPNCNGVLLVFDIIIIATTGQGDKKALNSCVLYSRRKHAASPRIASRRMALSRRQTYWFLSSLLPSSSLF
ncbi:hypothetical protein LY76DRAFT_180003 [Colletotrichum caudatum]|nr:hypothetical protein LY76DRAFT_180003 [Colletotrichum caudatum]